MREGIDIKRFTVNTNACVTVDRELGEFSGEAERTSLICDDLRRNTVRHGRLRRIFRRQQAGHADSVPDFSGRLDLDRTVKLCLRLDVTEPTDIIALC